MIEVWVLEQGCIYEGGNTHGVFEDYHKGYHAAIKYIKEQDWYEYKFEEEKSSEDESLWHGYTRQDDDTGEPFAIMYLSLKRYDIQ